MAAWEIVGEEPDRDDPWAVVGEEPDDQTFDPRDAQARAARPPASALQSMNRRAARPDTTTIVPPTMAGPGDFGSPEPADDEFRAFQTEKVDAALAKKGRGIMAARTLEEKQRVAAEPPVELAPAIRGLPEARAIPQSAVDRLAARVREATGSERIARAATGAADLGISFAKIGPQTGELAASIAQLLTGDLVGADARAFFEKRLREMSAAQSEGTRQKAARLAYMLRDPGIDAGQLSRWLIDDPEFLVNTALPSLGSMLVGAGAAGLGARMAGATGATRGATAANVLMNAGDTFTETQGDLRDRYTAAAIAALGTLAAGRLTGGGAEAQVGRRAAGVADDAALRGALAENPVTRTLVSGAQTGAREFSQEAIEGGSQELGQQIGEGRSVDAGAVAKAAATEGLMGAVLGGAAGVAMDARAARTPGLVASAMRGAEAVDRRREQAAVRAILDPATSVDQAIQTAVAASARPAAIDAPPVDELAAAGLESPIPPSKTPTQPGGIIASAVPQWQGTQPRVAATPRTVIPTIAGQPAPTQPPAPTVDAAAHEAATSPTNDLPEPTAAQKEAGNYAKGHVRIGGLDVSIENPAGSKRRPEWPTLRSHYGYIRRTEGADGDHVDTFVKPGTPDDWRGTVYVVDQVDPNKDPSRFDEHKVMLGFDSIEEARQAYLENYAPDWQGLKAITPAAFDAFRAWLERGDTKRPFAWQGEQSDASSATVPEQAAPPKPVAPPPQTSRKAILGKHGPRDIHFQSAQEAELFDAYSRLRKKTARGEDDGYIGHLEARLSAYLGVPVQNVGALAVQYHAAVMRAAREASAGAAVRAPRVHEVIAAARQEQPAPEPPAKRAATPAAKKDAPPLNLIQFPSGRWGFAGTVPDDVYYGDDATPEKIAAAKRAGERFGPSRRSFATREEATAFAETRGYRVGAVSPAAAPIESTSVPEKKVGEGAAPPPRATAEAQQPAPAEQSGAQGVAAAEAAEDALTALGFRQVESNVWVRTFREDERSTLVNVRAFGEPRRYRVTAAVSFPGRGVTGAPSQDVGTFDSSDAAADAIKARFVATLRARETDSGVALESRSTAPVFYSELARRIEALSMRAAQPRDWIENINALTKRGVKPDEIEWSGVREWLQMQSGKVTKEQVLDYLRANGVRVEEVVLEDRGRRTGGTVNDPQFGEIEFADNPREETKFASYQLPGGQNYRELLLTLPSNRQENRWRELHTKGAQMTAAERDEFNRLSDAGFVEPQDYRSPHWEQKNILAHVRFNERTDADGKRVLFIEELQSDWAQKGRKVGFGRPQGQPKSLADIPGAVVEPNSGSTDERRFPWRVRFGHVAYVGETREDAIRNALVSLSKPEGPPRAPFVEKTDAWVALALKRMIRYAAENGFDRVAWTTGEQQAARYDLSKQIESIGYKQRGELFDVSVWAKGRKTEVLKNQSADVKWLEDNLGKEIAKKIVDGEGRSDMGFKYLEGLDLKVGGEGMRTFYDQIVPKVANELLKKLGGGTRVDRSVIPVAEMSEQDLRQAARQEGNKNVAEVHGFDITAELRERALQGLALFADTRGVLPAFRRLTGEPGAQQALRDALGELAALDVDPGPIDVATEHDPARPDSPMRFDLGSRTVYYNTAFARHSRALDAQAMLEELLHAIDHTGGVRTISAGSPRLAAGGDLHTEVEAALVQSAALRDWLKYPLNAKAHPDLSPTRVQAELFARLGVFYAAHGDVLARIAPKTKAFYDRIFEPRRRGVSGEVQGQDERGRLAALGRPRPAGVESVGRDGHPRGPRPDAAGTGRPRSDDRLADLRRRIAEALGADERGAAVEFERGRRSLESRDRRPDWIRQQPAETQEALRRAGIHTDGRPLAQRVRDHVGALWDGIRDTFSRDNVAQSVFDTFHGIKRAERTLGNLPVEQSGYVAARLSTGVPAIMHAMLRDGAPEWRDGIIQKKPGSKGLLEVFAPVRDEFDDFIGWMVGRRARLLRSQGREHNLTDAHIDALLALGRGKEPVFAQVAADFAAYKRAVLDVAEQAGLIDATTRPAWDRADWIPFYRALADERVAGPRGRRGLAGQSAGIRRLRGGTAALNDPLENILLNFAHLMGASLKNHALRTTIDNVGPAGFVEKVGMQVKPALVPQSEIARALLDAGVPQDVIDAMPPEVFEGIRKMWSIVPPQDKDVVRLMRDGHAEYWRVHDELLLRALTGINSDAYGPAMRAIVAPMRAFKRVLTRGVTATPDFMLRNFIRDTVHAQIITKDRMIPVWSGFKGAAKSLTETGGGLDMMFAGGAFLGGHVSGTDPGALAEATRRALRSRGWRASSVDAFLATVVDTPVKLWEAWERVGNAVENANREAVYEAALRAGKSRAQAAFEAKDLMDYSMRGDWALIQFFADVLPFFNARLQGLYKLARASADGRTLIARHVAVRGGLLMLATLALAAANDGEDWYEELEEWDRDTYWHFKIAGQRFRIPKPFELGVVFGTIPERVYRRLSGSDDTKMLVQRVGWNIYEQMAMNPLPQFVRPALEIYANRSMFTGRPIEGMGDEGKLPHARYAERTSETARAVARAVPDLADAVGMSPKRMEFLVRGYLGEMGAYGLALTDLVVRQIEGAPPRPALRPDEIPLLKSFVRADPPFSTRWKTELYDMAREVEEIYRTVRAFEEQGRDDLALDLEDRKLDKLEQRANLRDAVDELRRLNRQAEEILRDPAMDRKEKREELDALAREGNAIAEEEARAARPPFRRLLSP